MAVVLSPDSELAKELAKWDQPNYRHVPFPKMVYKAWPRENGRVECGDPGVAVGDAVAEAFTRRCQRTVRDESEQRIAQGQGWYDTPTAAIAGYEAEQRAVATAAAEANFAVTKMSPKAQAERTKREAATDKQVPE